MMMARHDDEYRPPRIASLTPSSGLRMSLRVKTELDGSDIASEADSQPLDFDEPPCSPLRGGKHMTAAPATAAANTLVAMSTGAREAPACKRTHGDIAPSGKSRRVEAALGSSTNPILVGDSDSDHPDGEPVDTDYDTDLDWE